jgi:flagellar biogenesis protein FliO
VATGPSTVELLIRLVFSLGIILALLVVGAKIARRKGAGLSLRGLGGRHEPAIRVIERRSLTRNASVAVVQVGDRTMVVGITEHEVSLLADGAELPEPDAAPEGHRDRRRPVEIDLVEALDLVGAPPRAAAHGPADAPAAEPGPGTGARPTREAKWTAPPASGPAVDDVATGPEHPPRMSFVEALREMTVRKP